MSKQILTIFCLSISLTSCFKPLHHFSYYTPPPTPDYSLATNWAALPDKKDSADALPINSEEKDLQSTAKVDVFYIHPTVNFSPSNWNGNLSNKRLNRRADKYPIRMQASAFNGSCKVYAPRYRQATLYSFMQKKGTDGQQALNLAYSDVKKAFDYFLQNYNHNRPFIIAGHSQGSLHAYHLLSEYIENDPELRKRMIAAYIIGMSSEKTFLEIPPCDSATQVGCLISWNSFKWGAKSDNQYLAANKYCTNPLSWRRDSTCVGSEFNLGGVERHFKFINFACDAKVQSGILWVHKPKEGRFAKFGQSYHVSDYSLFYFDIRKNVKDRIAAYYKNK